MLCFVSQMLQAYQYTLIMIHLLISELGSHTDCESSPFFLIKFWYYPLCTGLGTSAGTYGNVSLDPPCGIRRQKKDTTLSNLGPVKDVERQDLNCAVKEYLLLAGYRLTAMTFYEEVMKTLMFCICFFFFLSSCLCYSETDKSIGYGCISKFHTRWGWLLRTRKHNFLHVLIIMHTYVQLCRV